MTHLVCFIDLHPDPGFGTDADESEKTGVPVPDIEECGVDLGGNIFGEFSLQDFLDFGVRGNKRTERFEDVLGVGRHC